MISKVLLELNHSYPSEMKVLEKVEIFNVKLSTDWIQNSDKQKLEEDWIDILSQTLLFSNQPDQTNIVFLHNSAKHFLDLLSIECQTGDKV